MLVDVSNAPVFNVRKIIFGFNFLLFFCCFMVLFGMGDFVFVYSSLSYVLPLIVFWIFYGSVIDSYYVDKNNYYNAAKDYLKKAKIHYPVDPEIQKYIIQNDYVLLKRNRAIGKPVPSYPSGGHAYDPVIIPNNCKLIGPPPEYPKKVPLIVTLFVLLISSVPGLYFFVNLIFLFFSDVYSIGFFEYFSVWFSSKSSLEFIGGAIISALLFLVCIVIIFMQLNVILSLPTLTELLEKAKGIEDVFFIKISYLIFPYLALGFFFSGGWLLLDIADYSVLNHSYDDFGIIEAIYYSFVTMTTLGYGEVTPNHWVSMLFSVWQTVLGVLYISVIVGVSVGYGLSISKLIKPSGREVKEIKQVPTYKRKLTRRR